MATATDLLTVEVFAAMPDIGPKTELVRGRIIEVPPPGIRHGLFCLRFGSILRSFVVDRGLGEVLVESGMITSRDPDSLRGPDISFYRAERLPPIDQWPTYFEFPADLIVEVRSPSDRWAEMVAKAAEYLAAGVLVVIVLDPETTSAHVFAGDQPPRMVDRKGMLTFPAVVPDFAVRVGAIFE